jgi:hypothetical protein
MTGSKGDPMAFLKTLELYSDSHDDDDDDDDHDDDSHNDDDDDDAC